MHSNPVKPARSLRTSRSASLRSSSLRSKADAEAKANAEGSQMGSSADTEEGIGMDEIDINIEPDLSKTLNQFALASDLWHYSTMDWGRRCEYPTSVDLALTDQTSASVSTSCIRSRRPLTQPTTRTTSLKTLQTARASGPG
jgi:hypothetical protein